MGCEKVYFAECGQMNLKFLKLKRKHSLLYRFEGEIFSGKLLIFISKIIQGRFLVQLIQRRR